LRIADIGQGGNLAVINAFEFARLGENFADMTSVLPTFGLEGFPDRLFVNIKIILRVHRLVS